MNSFFQRIVLIKTRFLLLFVLFVLSLSHIDYNSLNKSFKLALGGIGLLTPVFLIVWYISIQQVCQKINGWMNTKWKLIFWSNQIIIFLLIFLKLLFDFHYLFYGFIYWLQIPLFSNLWITAYTINRCECRPNYYAIINFIQLIFIPFGFWLLHVRVQNILKDNPEVFQEQFQNLGTKVDFKA